MAPKTTRNSSNAGHILSVNVSFLLIFIKDHASSLGGRPKGENRWLNSSFPGTPRNELRCLHRRGAAASQVADFKPQPPLYWNDPQKAVNTVHSNKSNDKSHTRIYEELLEISLPSDPGFKGFISKKICFRLLSSHSDSISCCLMRKKKCDLGIGKQAVMGTGHTMVMFAGAGQQDLSAQMVQVSEDSPRWHATSP